MHLLHAAGVGAEQLIELVEQGTQRVPGGDDLPVRLRDPGLPPAFSGGDYHAGMTLAELAQAQ